MGLIGIVLLGLVAFAAGLSLGLAVLLTLARTNLASVRAERDRARIAEAATTRVLRLAVTDLRATSMRLLGHTEQLGAANDSTVGTASPHITGILAMTRQLLGLADDMQDHAVSGPQTRVLELETLDLGPLLADAVASVTATLGPSRRHWRMGPRVGACVLTADRRALALILGRVVGNAARQSRHDDWIDIAVREKDGGMELAVEDEGTGLVAPGRASSMGQSESRGVGLGLVLARVLMEAHGGSLTVESAARVGTRVVLSLPPNRVAWKDGPVLVPAAA